MDAQSRIEIEFYFFCSSKKSCLPHFFSGYRLGGSLLKHNSHLMIQRLIHFWEILTLAWYIGGCRALIEITLKTDIINLLEGCNLTLENVKVNYSRGGYMPLEMLLQFPSPSAYAQASRVIARKGRLYKLERADRAQWDIIYPYDGKTILLQGLPRDVTMQDVERFLSCFENDQTSLNFFNRAAERMSEWR